MTVVEKNTTILPNQKQLKEKTVFSGKRKNIKKLMINGELVIEWKKEKSIKVVVVENICYD